MSRIHVQPSIGFHLLEVYILADRPDGVWIQRQRASEPPTFEFLCKEGEAPPVNVRPSFFLHPQDARQLVDALSGQGFMPGEVGQIKGELTATKKHLEDMRHIVFMEPREKLILAGPPQTEFEFPTISRKT